MCDSCRPVTNEDYDLNLPPSFRRISPLLSKPLHNNNHNVRASIVSDFGNTNRNPFKSMVDLIA